MSDLFSADALARATDPETSHQAAAAMEPHIGDAQRRALRAVERHPGRTATELANLAGDGDPRRINRRLGELERAGAISRSGPRRCAHTGRNAATWWPAPSRHAFKRAPANGDDHPQ